MGMLMLLLLSLVQIVVFVITLCLFIADYKKKKVTLSWLWWIITPFALFFIGLSLIELLFGIGIILYFLPFLLQLVVLIVYLAKRKKSTGKTVSVVANVNDIPAVCPHCKSPNTKKLYECEWCGSEVC